MSSLRTDIISALWKGPKVVMLVIVESTLAEPRNANHCVIEHKADRSDPERMKGFQFLRRRTDGVRCVWIAHYSSKTVRAG